jgi:predicted nucleotidyltransferase
LNKLLRILRQSGPLTGKKIVESSGLDSFTAWRECTASDQLQRQIVGKRYLRLDRRVNGYARLSPSIMREFLNYTVVGAAGDEEKIVFLAGCLADEISLISRRKKELAREIICRTIKNCESRLLFEEQACVIIAGDVVYNMAHAEPRPEPSTGELVRGSDLDIIVVVEKLSPAILARFDELLYREKYNLLLNPAVKEEIDYVIKDLQTVEEQLRFHDFKAMVASKILDEGEFLSGSRVLYDRIKRLAEEADIPDKLEKLKKKAQSGRLSAEKKLLTLAHSRCADELGALFYTSEEKEEIF